MPLSTLLLGGAVLSFGVSMMFWAATRRSWVLQTEIMHQYRRAGLEIDRARAGQIGNPWSAGGALEAAISLSPREVSFYRVLRYPYVVSAVAVFLGISLLPVAAQSTACIEVSQAYGGGPAWLLLLIPLFTLTHSASVTVVHVED